MGRVAFRLQDANAVFRRSEHLARYRLYGFSRMPCLFGNLRHAPRMVHIPTFGKRSVGPCQSNPPGGLGALEPRRWHIAPRKRVRTLGPPRSFLSRSNHCPAASSPIIPTAIAWHLAASASSACNWWVNASARERSIRRRILSNASAAS